MNGRLIKANEHHKKDKKPYFCHDPTESSFKKVGK